ncbi:pantoate--beta-alanine ligase [Paenalkalicoccus suaedae]|uniref:Pantothenate synthetase n=1 Tax=Paenalkalicoccus suaedae TaxID=2592382 RepID=A0A859FEJ0_9BACI|nr:pantoate--beta-alanine ligase [Paenalkalicoccus suaedae]QKS71122.1 pantoate--beta-alanine ligase [Paenalkalicoccus suaedae]
MIRVETIKELKAILRAEREKGHTIGFVPTMGYLHEGHMTLVDEATKSNDCVVMSIFVNPLQFGPTEDFDSYPRDLERDALRAKERGVTILFTPNEEEMYKRKMSATLQVHDGVNVLCGAKREGHFDGVATVVMKLLNIVSPTHAYFGKKDAQQVAIIWRMVEDFEMDVTIVPVDIVREEDGLAMSSRNVRLTPYERKEAPRIYALLKHAIAQSQTVEELLDVAFKQAHELELAELDYVELRTFPDLKEATKLEGQLILAIAMNYEHARLIDNIIWEPTRKDR